MFVRGVLSILGRVLLCAIFAMSGPHHALEFDQTVGMMEQHHVPYPKVLLPGAVAFLVIGSISVITGYKARFGAFLLLVFLALASYYFHNFWDLTDPGAKQNQMNHFMKNVGLAGAMLFIIANGPGAGSLDNRRPPAAP